MKKKETSKKQALLPLSITAIIGIIILLYVYLPPISEFEISPGSDDVIVIFGDN